MNKLVVLFVFILIATGCSNNEVKKVAHCEMNKNGIEINGELTALGDHLISQKQESIIDLKEVGLNNDQAHLLIKEYEKKYNNLKGVTYENSIKDDKMFENITINLEEADLNKLNEEKLIQAEGSNIKNVNFKESIKVFESMGMKCEIE